MGSGCAAMVVGDSVSMSLHVQHNCPSLSSPERRKKRRVPRLSPYQTAAHKEPAAAQVYRKTSGSLVYYYKLRMTPQSPNRLRS